MFHKMLPIMQSVLSTELTYIPSSIQNVLGNNFNNTLCNGVTWLFAIWLLLHFCYNRLLNAYLKQLGLLQYLRSRLDNSIWMLIFYFAFLIYYLITLSEYHLFNLMNIKRVLIGHYEEVANHKIFAQALLCSFYLHMGYNHGILSSSLHSLLKFLSLILVFTTSYNLRLLEMPFTLTALVAISGIFEELTKLSYSLLNREHKLSRLLVNFLFISSVVLFCAVYFATIPLSYIVPLGTRLFSSHTNCLQIVLFFSLLCWLNLVIYKSMLLNLIFHWLYHLDEKGTERNEDEKQTIKLNCLGNIIECSLFPPRTDEGYMMGFLRSEAKMRQNRMIAKRKPKNRSMLIQTLKCMIAIKRKLSEKKAENSDIDDSDESDEKAEQVPLIDDFQEKHEKDDNVDNESRAKNFIVVKKSDKIMKFADRNIGLDSKGQEHSDEEEIEISTIDEITEYKPDPNDCNETYSASTNDKSKELKVDDSNANRHDDQFNEAGITGNIAFSFPNVNSDNSLLKATMTVEESDKAKSNTNDTSKGAQSTVKELFQNQYNTKEKVETNKEISPSDEVGGGHITRD